MWLGHYDNAFRLMRDCYAELDREHRDPDAPIKDWLDAFFPSSDIGIFDNHAGEWRPWIGHFARNDRLPGDPDDALAVGGQPEILRRVARLMHDLVESFEPADARTGAVAGAGARTNASACRRVAASVIAAGAMVEALAMAAGPVAERASAEAVAALDVALARSSRRALGNEHRGLGRAPGLARHRDDRGGHPRVDRRRRARRSRRAARGSTTRSSSRGSVATAAPKRWSRRPMCAASTTSCSVTRPGTPSRAAFGAGLGAVLSIKTMLGYSGAFFWKMTAGMGDVVFAPMYEVLRARGVDFEFFHRVDALHLSDDGAVDRHASTSGRQVRTRRRTATRTQPLVRVKGLPCFPDAPLRRATRLPTPPLLTEPLESAWCAWPDAEQRVLRRGVDFDHVVFAIPPPMARHVAGELIDARPEWRHMVEQRRHRRDAVAPALAAVVGSRPRLGRDRHDHDRLRRRLRHMGVDAAAARRRRLARRTDRRPSRTSATRSPARGRREAAWAEHADGGDGTRARHRRTVLSRRPARRPARVQRSACCAADLDAQYWRANVDPSDRYVQSLPGTDRYRLRPDESGFENLVLAGDWTDCGLNAGCIEAAVLSGLEAANALLGRHRFHRVLPRGWCRTAESFGGFVRDKDGKLRRKSCCDKLQRNPGRMNGARGGTFGWRRGGSSGRTRERHRADVAG